jgi:uncharacterized protein YeaO (DUF488 family)
VFKLKRVYEEAVPGDGFRVLVDRLWPRGVSKERAQLGLWLKDAAPSPELRKWFGHVPERWPEFEQRYRAEVADNPAVVRTLRDLEREHGTVTLLFGARDEERNEAVVLWKVLGE